MKIIFAQGNPGTQYTHTRHNVGFWFLDSFAASHNISFTKKTKFHADIAELSVGSEKVLLVKPATFYNETGVAARALCDFYKVHPAKDFLAIHDDLALPFGTIRTRASGSDAGNNGIRSLNAHLGTNYHRIRIGIYSPLRDRIDDVDFVIGTFSGEEKKALPDIFQHVEQFTYEFIQGSLTLTKVAAITPPTA